VIVRVNDRGPFVDNRIIDLSYAAATKLDMVRDGTSLVEVTAIGLEEAGPVTVVADNAAGATGRADTEPAGQGRIFVQVGAFGDPDNARRRHDQLQDGGIARAFVHEDGARRPVLYRVRIGPIADATEYDSIVARLSRLGIDEAHLVTD
jgi:rare lipoprotein A